MFSPAPHPSERWAPSMDVFETEREYVVKLEVPGVRKQDLKVGFRDNTLTVAGERREDDPGAKVSFLRMEIGYGEFRREIRFHHTVDREGVKAHYNEGFLKVVLPKR